MSEQDPTPSAWLTEDEHRALKLTAELSNLFGSITGDGRTRHADLGEAVPHIHALQRMVMAQAAGRAYPGLYRLMGGTVADGRVATSPLPTGIIIGRNMRVVREEMVPAVVAATRDYSPVVSQVQSRIRWADGRMAYLHSDTDPERLRGLSVGWAYVEPGCLRQESEAHLRMALREQPGTIFHDAGDVLAVFG